jgi:alcohol dehydrogenase class IV
LLARLGVSTSADLPTLVSDLQGAVGVPRSLSELGIDRAGFDLVAGQAFDEMIAYGQNPRRPESPDELVTILERAFG